MLDSQVASLVSGWLLVFGLADWLITLLVGCVRKVLIFIATSEWSNSVRARLLVNSGSEGPSTLLVTLASHVGMDTPDGQCHKSNGGNIT